MVDTDDTRRTTDDGRRTTPRVWHKLPTGEPKIFETVVFQQLSSYLINNELLSKSQYGFRKNIQRSMLFCK